MFFKERSAELNHRVDKELLAKIVDSDTGQIKASAYTFGFNAGSDADHRKVSLKHVSGAEARHPDSYSMSQG